VTLLRRLASILRGLVRRDRAERDLNDELQAFVDMAAANTMHEGVSPEEARRLAVLQLGGVEQVKERIRAARHGAWLDDIGRDVCLAWRTCGRSPGFSAVVILTLALGIGANTAIFSLADAVVFRPLPVSDPEGLVVLRQRGPGGDIFPFTSGAAAHLAGSGGPWSGLAAFRPVPATPVTVNGETDLALVQCVSGNYHAVLGIHAVIGRPLVDQDREPVAVISHRFWQRRFEGDPNVLGRVIEMQGRSFTIVGVTPPEFFGTQPGRHVDVTTPLGAGTMTLPPNARWLYLIGRLAPGVSREQAQATLDVRWTQLADATLGSGDRVTLEMDSGAQGLNELRREFSAPLRILTVVAGLVLLIACANLTGLLILRSGARQQEMAIRLSLGAGRGRLVRQLLTESALLAVAGGALALGLAYWSSGVLLAMMSRGRTPIALDVTLNARTLLFATAMTMAVAALVGLIPALGASRTDEHAQLKRGVPGADCTRSLWGRMMVSAQIAILLLLLASAGLFARNLQTLLSVDTGFRQDQVLVVGVSTGPAYRGAAGRVLYEELYSRFSAVPGVRSVSMSLDTPGADLSVGAGIAVPGHPADPADAPPVFHNFVGPRFFETMGIPVLSGRDFEPGDDERAPRRVAISESVARRYFEGQDPIGRQIVLGGPYGAGTASIIGVVKDVRYASPRTEPPPVVYRGVRQEVDAPPGAFLIRTSADAAAVTPFLRAEVRAAAPALPPPSVISLDDRMAAVLVDERMLATLSSVIGLLAAILGAIGVYSTVAMNVTRRQREIGIRMALGARPGEVSRMVVGEAFWIVAGGLAVGIPGALAAALGMRGFLAGVLFELSPMDPLVLSTSTLMILSIAAVAAYVPARRAARIDPVAAIKYE
jgi:predicted permease